MAGRARACYHHEARAWSFEEGDHAAGTEGHFLAAEARSGGVMMMTTLLHLRRTAAVAGLVLFLGSAVHAQEKIPFPSLSDKRVYVVDVPDRYQGLAEQINRLERTSPQTYYVVVMKSTGAGGSATREYAEQLFDRWRTEAARSRRAFDADRSVLIVVALETRQVALHPGAVLASQFGLTAEPIESELISRAFIGPAKEGKFPEAISALLNATNNWVAVRDSQTNYVSVKVSASNPSAGSRAGLTPATKATTSPEKTGTTSKTAATAAPRVRTPEAAGVNASTAQAQSAVPARTSASGLATTMIWVLITAFVLVLLATIWVKYMRAKSRVASRLKQIKSQAVDVMDHLDALKDRLKLLPTSSAFSEPIAGETQALYNACQEKATQLWDGWLVVMEALDKASGLAERSASPFARKTLEEAEKLIEQRGSFEQIETQAQAIAADVDRIDQAHASARRVLEALTSERPKLESQLKAVKKCGLPTAPYEGELGPLAEETARASALVPGDPLGTQKVLEALRARSGDLLTRIERVVSLFAEAQQVRTALDSIRQQVASHRSGGLMLRENGGNPDEALGQGEQACSETLAALKAGDPDAGARQKAAADSLVQAAHATIDKVQKAKAFCERDIPARLRETERLRTALPQAESYQNDLEREFAASSWQTVSRNLEQAKALLATFDRQAQDAASAAASPRQEYLRGAGLLERTAQQQQIVLRLMSGLGEQLNGLIAVRNESRQLIENLAARQRQVETYIRQYDAIVGNAARESLASARRTAAQVTARAGEARPDWPTVRRSLAEAIEELSIAQSRAEAEVTAHEELTREFNSVRQTASRVYALLASRREDRLAANQRYQAAAEVLDRIALEMAEPRGESERLLEQLRSVMAELDRAEQLAREDIRLAGQAQSEINEAAQSIERARSYGPRGIAVDLGSAESQLMQARQFLQSQSYEQAIQAAGVANQAARQIYFFAMQQALAQQAAVQAEERRQAARLAAPAWNGVSVGAAAATAAAATILNNAAATASEPEMPFEAEMASEPEMAREPEAVSEPETAAEPEPAAEPATGAGSWSSDTGQGSW
jgi:hypothetical protein